MSIGRHPSVPEVFSYYRELLKEEARLEAAVCWTVVVPHAPGPVSVSDIGARVSGGTRYAVHEAAPLEVFPDGGELPMHVGVEDGAVVLFENNGFLGSLPDVLRRLSRGGRDSRDSAVRSAAVARGHPTDPGRFNHR
ncbi:hypothetical protein [Thermoactinospora rubra]|uniref:hypothetical protein n=1 Tax=Thermoactinospora rubra TaxID=1088767 RepID=UPI000A10C905|nr:hypothetical protein [Thermoactinospora rubra]